MEILLAMVVISAVIFFGALLSMGNERQRRAIDDLREQVVLWAVQDLKIKREKLARTVQVPDPLGWLNKQASKVYGYDLDLQVLEMFEAPQALVCTSAYFDMKIIFSPVSPSELRQARKNKKSSLFSIIGDNPLLTLPRNVIIREISVLNGGLLFDLELSLAWKDLSGRSSGDIQRIWAYFFKEV